jgi:type I restriction enzyme S subunit
MEEARLGDVVASMKNGIYKPASAYAEDGTPCLRMYNIDAGSIVWRDIKRMKVTTAEQVDYGLQEGDLLVNRVNSRELVGKTAVIPAGMEPSVFESKNIRVRLDTAKALPKFINYQLLARGSRHFANNAQQVVGMASISQGQLADFPIVLMDLDEQRRIVAEIEKQFFRLDEAVANLQRVKANLKRYKASVLKAAVEGRLVETEASIAQREGRSYEKGEQLLQRILEVRREQPKGKSKYKDPALPNLNAVTELPEGWAWASVEQVVAHLTDGDHQAPPQTDAGVPFLVIGNVRSGEIDLSITRFVGEDYYNSLDPSRQPAKGDLLYTLVGSYGIPVRVKTTERFCIQRHMAILRPHAESPMDYLTIAMASDNVFKQATEVSTGTAQMTVPLGGLRSIAIGLPPKPEQVRIVAEVDRLLSVICELETEVDGNLQRAPLLRQAILIKQFSV